jgi:acyl carrier protein
MDETASTDGRGGSRTAAHASETERQVAQIFADVLGLRWVAPEDDIFSLGGDSFEAVRVALELERRFQVEFPVQMLESAGRVREIASWIDSRGASARREEPSNK